MCENRHLISLYRSYYSFYLIVLDKNKCLGTIAIVKQGEQIAIVESDIVLWHNSIGHMSEKGMKVLYSKNYQV